MTAMDSIKAKFHEYEYLLKMQTAKIEELAAENERLRADADAHGVLKAVYLDREAPQSLRVKAATAALPHEKPKLLSVLAPIEMDRREAWRVYERWALRREIIKQTRDVPPVGWDAHLVGDTYQPPDGDDMPPVRVVKDSTSGFRTLDNLLPGAGRNGTGTSNGNGSDEPSGAD